MAYECILLVPTMRQAGEINKTLPEKWKAFSYEQARAGLRTKMVIISPPPKEEYVRAYERACEDVRCRVLPGGSILRL
jgi:hypothetical protein